MITFRTIGKIDFPMKVKKRRYSRKKEDLKLVGS